MKCKQVQELMGAYIYGDLAADEMRRIRLHAQECVHCRKDIQTGGAVVSSLDNKAPELTDEDRLRIAWSVKAVVNSEPDRRAFRWWSVTAFGLAAAVVAGIIVAKVVVSNGSVIEQPRVARQSRPVVKVTEDKAPTVDRMAENIAPAPSGDKPRRSSRSIDFGRIGNVIVGVSGPAIATTTTGRGHRGHKRTMVQVDPPAPIVAMPVASDIGPDVKTNNSEHKLPKPTNLNDAQTTAPSANEGTTPNAE